jgi:hypothetical protein
MADDQVGGTPPPPPPPPPASTATADADAELEDDPQVFTLSRELSEVHLLLDNLSADPDTTLETLSSREPPKGLQPDWIERICQISWPPSPSDVKKAEQASLLIRAKDYLNRLARPASGMSIAFTIMVTQKDDEGQPPVEARRPGVDMDETLWRSSLAEIAYPDLRARAADFRKWMWRISAIVIFWLVLTCFFSWYVAFGNLALGEYKVATERLIAAQIVVNDAEAGRSRVTAADAAAAAATNAGAPAAGTTTTRPTLPPQAGATQKPGLELGYCERWRLYRPLKTRVGQLMPYYEGADQLQACRELLESRKQVLLARKRLSQWLPGGNGRQPDAAAIATRLANTMGTAILPVLYGFLGAAAAVLRSVSSKIRYSTLSPRDLSLSLQQLALGAVVGACIGLFIVGGDTTFIGPVTLSGSAISFVAGFGVDAVFQALEALISRLFNIAPAGGSRGGASAGGRPA